MEGQRLTSLSRVLVFVLIMVAIAVLAFFSGLYWSQSAHAKPRVIYKKNTKLDFTGLSLDGELKNPAEFYFQRRPEEKFNSLVKRRKNFHQQMLRDAVLSQ